MPTPKYVNDVHSRLTPTTVSSIHEPRTPWELQKLVRRARLERRQLSICGGRNSMGGQPYGRECHLVDLAKMEPVFSLDEAHGLLRVSAGMMWPEVIERLKLAGSSWGIRQKQTGADRLTLGGGLSVNMHGRGLGMAPFVEDLEELSVVAANGVLYRCSRTSNQKLFSLVVGGLGCFGIVVEIVLRLKKRERYRREVKLIKATEAVSWLEKCRNLGAEYGDFQFQIDPNHEGFLQEGISSCYFPTCEHLVAEKIPKLAPQDIENLLHLAHEKPGDAFQQYTNHYLKTDGRIYDGDEMQLSAYPAGYHQRLDQKCAAMCPGSEMITELSVPRNRLSDFLASTAEFLRKSRSKVIYGTVRLIEKDPVTFLPWARGPRACVVFNLHVDHCPEGIRKAKEEFRGLIDLSLEREGTFYLAYHRWATKEQLLQAYPEFPEWLRLKRWHDPVGLWNSDWFRWLEELVEEESCFLSPA